MRSARLVAGCNRNCRPKLLAMQREGERRVALLELALSRLPPRAAHALAVATGRGEGKIAGPTRFYSGSHLAIALKRVCWPPAVSLRRPLGAASKQRRVRANPNAVRPVASQPLQVMAGQNKGRRNPSRRGAARQVARILYPRRGSPNLISSRERGGKHELELPLLRCFTRPFVRSFVRSFARLSKTT